MDILFSVVSVREKRASKVFAALYLSSKPVSVWTGGEGFLSKKQAGVDRGSEEG